jgi:hypothetical protein
MDDVFERDGITYIALATTVAMKVLAFTKRRMAPKGATDLADLRRLLLAHPELRAVGGVVADRLRDLADDEQAQAVWCEIVEAEIVSDEDADEGY